MLNRVLSPFDETSGASEHGAWHTDSNPVLRLTALFVVIALPLLAVIGRVAYLQAVVVDDFVAQFKRTTESFEPIPSRDGRILGSDGRVLAHDAEQMDVHVHYRWLEDPPDKDWLRHQALSRLDRRQRRDAAAIERETRAVLELRDQMWQRFAVLTGVAPEELTANKADVQRRIERIVAAVERNRRRAEEQSIRSHQAALPSDASWWRSVEHAVVTAVTSPPRRDKQSPLIVQEELQYHPLIEDVTLGTAVEIEAHPELYPGLLIATSTRRIYPQSTIAPHVIGSRTPLTDEQFAERQTRFPQGDPLDYRAGNRIGRSGAELSYDRRLRGLRGLRKIVKNRLGEVIAAEVVRKPRHGGDVVLTLHFPLQERVEQLLDDALATPPEEDGAVSPGASIVVLDVYSGAVLVAASAPRFDLNLLINPDPESWQRVLNDPRQPLFHRVTDAALTPGSVFKTLTAIAVLESRRIDPFEKLFCQGYLDRPDRFRCYVYRHFGQGHGDVDLTEALCQSCNVYFYDAARKMGADPVDAARHLSDWAARFGFGSPAGIDLPTERGGNVPSPDRLAKTGPAGGRAPVWHSGETLGMAIGQARLTTTPLQIARLMAAVANGGYLVTPYVVSGTGPVSVGEDSLELSVDRRPQPVAGLSDGTLELVREGLRMVVENERGTGYKTVRLDEVTIAGKTGTAEVGGGKPDHAWFAGYVPADEPRYAFVVVLEHAGSGGRAAGPVAQRVVQSMLDVGLLRPNRLTLRERDTADESGEPGD